MEITEEQRKRSEANRLAALAKLNRAAATVSSTKDVWKLFKCERPSHGHDSSSLPKPENLPTLRFSAVLEICGPDSFSITPHPVNDAPFPGQDACLREIDSRLSPAILSNKSQRGHYKLKDYDAVLSFLKKIPGVILQSIPWKTLAVVKKFSHNFLGNHWIPCMPSHLSDDDVSVLLGKLPKVLSDALLPFQLDGVKFALRRGGRCLIADEMGLGKTIQAIAIASCFMSEGPILVACPAVLRFSWAEELERWLPICLPTEIHLVFGRHDNLRYLAKSPKVVVISYTMLRRLQKCMLELDWSLMIVDECHNIRCTKKMKETEETQAVLNMAAKVKRIILLSGTPSLSRPYDIFHQINMLWPGLLGKDKYEFANNYCSIKFARGSEGKIFKDFSNGIRLEELNVLLTQAVMIRRLKENLLQQLPPKRRQVLRMRLKGPDIAAATAACRDSGMANKNSRIKRKSLVNNCTNENDVDLSKQVEAVHDDIDSNCFRGVLRQLSFQALGIAKLSGFREWLATHFILSESQGTKRLDLCSLQKTIIFAHHIRVLDGVQEFASEKGIGFIRIDGSSLPKDRQAAVLAFQRCPEVKLAIIGITVGGVGIDLSVAQNVVFLELPKSASEMLQAEDRAHRRGQTNAVNIYFFCAKDTLDETHWQYLNKSLCRISSVMNGKDDAIKEIEVDRVCDLDLTQCLELFPNSFRTMRENCEVRTSGPGIDNLASEIGIFHHASNTSPELMETSGLEMEILKEHSATPEESKLSFSKLTDAEYTIRTDDINFKANIVRVPKLVDSSLSRESKYQGIEADVRVTCSDSLSGMDDKSQKNESKSLRNEANSELSGKLGICQDSREPSVNLNTLGNELRHVLPEEVICGYPVLDANHSISSDALRFEVSRNTGRVHLYACISGKDSRPSPLFENFRPEDIDSMISRAADMGNEASTNPIKNNVAHLSVFLNFAKEWNDLRPIERNKLLGKPLQLPLSLELCFLKETINHEYGGLLKGGSKRRVTPISCISNPLPPNAEWRKILLCHGVSKKEKEYSQAWTTENKPLCKLCQTPCKGKMAKEPEFFEDLFCDLSCFQEYRIRTSQQSLRSALFQIEHGVCSLCELDCHNLIKCIRPLSSPRRREIIKKVAPKVASQKNLFDKLVKEPNEGNAWHADHIVPVYRGGGECRLENMRTLCVACHSEATSAQREERKLMKINAKEQLKALLKELTYDKQKTDFLEPTCFATEERTDELLIDIPGSAYSTTEREVSECKLNDSSSALEE